MKETHCEKIQKRYISQHGSKEIQELEGPRQGIGSDSDVAGLLLW